MAINVHCPRPVITVTDTTNDWRETSIIGTDENWDWLFRELADKPIASIKLIRQLNPGICLKDAKDAYEAMKPHRGKCY